MGYRSDVAVGIQFPTRDDLIGFCTFMRMNSNKHVMELLEEFSEVIGRDDDHVIMYTVDSVKWYDSYPEVQAMEFVLKMAQERDYATVFMRVGENYDDIEVEWHEPDAGKHSCLYDLFDISRNILFPSNVKPLKLGASIGA